MQFNVNVMTIRTSRLPQSIRLLLVAGALVLGIDCASADPSGRPVGKNCQLLEPPADAGENGGHGVLIQVYPRNGSIDATYSGCQAVFFTGAKEATRLAWLTEVTHGNPVRMWSQQPELRSQANCRYQHGKLINGMPDACRSAKEPMLMPTEPAGCFTGNRPRDQCDHDVDDEEQGPVH